MNIFVHQFCGQGHFLTTLLTRCKEVVRCWHFTFHRRAQFEHVFVRKELFRGTYRKKVKKSQCLSFAQNVSRFLLIWRVVFCEKAKEHLALSHQVEFDYLNVINATGVLGAGYANHVELAACKTVYHKLFVALIRLICSEFGNTRSSDDTRQLESCSSSMVRYWSYSPQSREARAPEKDTRMTEKHCKSRVRPEYRPKSRSQNSSVRRGRWIHQLDGDGPYNVTKTGRKT